jgi:hypothetical protein
MHAAATITPSFGPFRFCPSDHAADKLKGLAKLKMVVSIQERGVSFQKCEESIRCIDKVISRKIRDINGRSCHAATRVSLIIYGNSVWDFVLNWVGTIRCT